MTINLYGNEGDSDNIPYIKSIGEKSDSMKFEELSKLTRFEKSKLLKIEDEILKLKSNIFYGSKKCNGDDIELFSSRDKRIKSLGNYVSGKDACKFMEAINQKIKNNNYSGLVLYISAHGSFGEDGKHINFSDNVVRRTVDGVTCDVRNRASLKNLLTYAGMNNEKFKSIPKIILNDNCYGSNREYADAQALHTSKNGGELKPSSSRKSGKNKPNIIVKDALWNTIIFNASVEQNPSFDRSLLDAFVKFIKNAKNNQPIDILELSHDLINEVQGETVYCKTSLTQTEVNEGLNEDISEKELYDDGPRVVKVPGGETFEYYRYEVFPKMFEIEVYLPKTFSL